MVLTFWRLYSDPTLGASLNYFKAKKLQSSQHIAALMSFPLPSQDLSQTGFHCPAVNRGNNYINITLQKNLII